MATSRRQFLVRSAGLTAGATIPGSLILAAPALADEETDALIDIVGLEQASGLMYATIADVADLSADTKQLVKEFQGQEENHVTAFAEALDQLGEDAPSTPTDVADVDELQGLEQAKTEKEAIAFAIKLEEKLVGAYLAATSELDSIDIIRSGSQVGANHMQHLAALRVLGGATLEDAIALPQAKPAGEDSSSDSSDSSSTDANGDTTSSETGSTASDTTSDTTDSGDTSTSN